MKTKDFIKKLQEADPSGELHVRVRSPGEPTGAGIVPGYWDGYYHYTTESDGLVITDKEPKLDVFCEEIDTFIWNQEGRTDNILIDLMKGVNGEDRAKGLREYVLEQGLMAKEAHDQIMAVMKDRVLTKMAEGWKIIQSANYPTGQCHKQWYVKDPDKFIESDELDHRDTDNQKKLFQGECQVVIYGGLFTHRQDGKLVYWEQIKNDIP